METRATVMDQAYVSKKLKVETRCVSMKKMLTRVEDDLLSSPLEAQQQPSHSHAKIVTFLAAGQKIILRGAFSVQVQKGTVEVNGAYLEPGPAIILISNPQFPIKNHLNNENNNNELYNKNNNSELYNNDNELNNNNNLNINNNNNLNINYNNYLNINSNNNDELNNNPENLNINALDNLKSKEGKPKKKKNNKKVMNPWIFKVEPIWLNHDIVVTARGPATSYPVVVRIVGEIFHDFLKVSLSELEPLITQTQFFGKQEQFQFEPSHEDRAEDSEQGEEPVVTWAPKEDTSPFEELNFDTKIQDESSFFNSPPQAIENSLDREQPESETLSSSEKGALLPKNEDFSEFSFLGGQRSELVQNCLLINPDFKLTEKSDASQLQLTKLAKQVINTGIQRVAIFIDHHIAYSLYYFLNQIQTQFKYILDVAPNCPFFGNPGCVSLFEFNSPLFSPWALIESYQNLSSVFVGDKPPDQLWRESCLQLTRNRDISKKGLLVVSTLLYHDQGSISLTQINSLFAALDITKIVVLRGSSDAVFLEKLTPLEAKEVFATQSVSHQYVPMVHRTIQLAQVFQTTHLAKLHSSCTLWEPKWSAVAVFSLSQSRVAPSQILHLLNRSFIAVGFLPDLNDLTFKNPDEREYVKKNKLPIFVQGEDVFPVTFLSLGYVHQVQPKTKKFSIFVPRRDPRANVLIISPHFAVPFSFLASRPHLMTNLSPYWSMTSLSRNFSSSLL